jgi:hypothetical protein
MRFSVSTILLAICVAGPAGHVAAQAAPYTVTKGQISSAMQPQIRLDVERSI